MPCTACGASLTSADPFCSRCGARRLPGVPVPADPQRAALERAIGNQYDILRLLGRGGMGAVYLARERSLDRLVAIKVLPPETATDADSRERFRREARTAAKLVHPNIVPLFAFGDVDGMLYFVMGYVKGESLADRLRREETLSPEVTRRILRDVADALEHAHRQGVVHRDIKPDNVLLDDETGRPMLTDFGIAKARVGEGTLTAAGVVVGTPLYMSPEQASGAREIDGRSDLYSLGVLGYQMLSGRPPFEGDGFQDLIVQHISREPPPLAARAPEAPSDLVAAVTRCLAKVPEQRWPDARSLAAAVGSDSVEEENPQSFVLTSLDHGLIGAASVGMPSLLFLGLGVAASRLGTLGPLYLQLGLFLGAIGLVGFPLMEISVAAIARHRGHSWAEIKALFLRPPRRWPFWWPAAWRRRGDLWGRLPAILKRSRILQTTGAGLAVTTLMTCLVMLIVKGLGGSAAILQVLAGAMGVQGLGAVAALFSATYQREKWGRLLGLSARDVALAGEKPTTDLAFWRTPKFAALLEPSCVAKPALAEPQSPQECVAAIGEAARQLADPLRDLGREAAAAARQLASTIAELDAEIGQLARDASPGDLAAVEQKLAALAEPAADTEARRQMRALLESQRDLLRRLDERLGELREQRARLADLLRTMWLQLATLRAEAAHDTLAVTEISGRIRALCTDIGAHVKAAETVRAVTRP